MTFGEKLRTLRLKKELTQMQLAKEAGLGLNTISNYEKGKTYPQNREVYATLAKILDVSPDYLHNENDDFLAQTQQQYGSRGVKQAQELVSEVSGLFAGGEMAEEDMDEMMEAIQKAYWVAKKNNKKFTPKKYVTDEQYVRFLGHTT